MLRNVALLLISLSAAFALAGCRGVTSKPEVAQPEAPQIEVTQPHALDADSLWICDMDAPETYDGLASVIEGALVLDSLRVSLDGSEVLVSALSFDCGSYHDRQFLSIYSGNVSTVSGRAMLDPAYYGRQVFTGLSSAGDGLVRVGFETGSSVSCESGYLIDVSEPYRVLEVEAMCSDRDQKESVEVDSDFEDFDLAARLRPILEG
ncbi:MAG: hypothetical protein AAGG50_07655 [Bacteroidota bacterium]